MIHCPNLTSDNRCQVASHLAGVAVQATSSGCGACDECPTPQAVNLVTIGMAIATRRRRNQSVEDLKRILKDHLPDQETPATLRIAAYRPGPGSELRKMLAWFARPSDTCQCETRAETMNDWGVEGCRANLETIIDWLLEEAEQRGLPHGKFTKTIARSLVLTAIRRFEKKFPEGHVEPEENEDE